MAAAELGTAAAVGVVVVITGGASNEGAALAGV